MKKTPNLNNIGYDSWLQLYEELVSEGLEREDEIILEWTAEEKHPPVEISLDFIRSMAFLELYATLPLASSVDIVKNLITEGNCSQVVSFLNNLKTRPV